MVTIINDKTNKDSLNKYNILFKKAWSYLRDEKLLKDEDVKLAQAGQEKFADLGHYLSYIEELMITNDASYILLPFDEEPFHIDANSRMIRVPDDFKKCSGVKNDSYAEIITFTIDRYFDYKDLDRTNIAVQWINAKGEEGISFIHLKDIETYGDKNLIRFGWPLTQEMTAKEGNLQFAVRFYTQEQTDKGIKFNYVFNTIPTSIPIKSSLNIDFNDENVVKMDASLSEFTKFVTNSINPSYGPLHAPTFSIYPPEKASVGSDNTLTLEAQAKCAEGTPVSYEWIKVDSAANKTTLDEDNDDGVYKITTGWIPFTIDPWPLTRPKEDLWTKDNLGYYHTYLPSPWPESKPEAITELFSRKSVLHFGDTNANILGTYYVRAINSNQVNSVDYIKPESGCVIAGPAAIKFAANKNLPFAKFISDVSTENKISFTLVKDENNPNRTYTFYKDGVAIENPNYSEENNTITFSYSDCGEYKVKIESRLNRQEAEAVESNVCRIYNQPIVLHGDMKINNSTVVPDENNIYKIDATTIGTEYTLCVTPNNGNSDNTGTVTYQWTCQRGADAVAEKLDLKDMEAVNGVYTFTNPESDLVSFNAITGELKVRAIAPSSKVFTYSCVISNTIDPDDLDAVTKTSDPYIFWIH